MNLNFKQLRHNVESVILTMPYNYATLKAELDAEAWAAHADYAERSGDPHVHRATLGQPQSTMLQDILAYLSSDDVKKQVIDTLYKNNPDMQSNWDGWSADKMFKKTLWGGQYLRDNPGFSIDKHIDSRIQIVTMIIYFIEQDDPNQATFFYTDKHGNDQVRATTNFGEGVCFVNDFDVWHEGYNKSNLARYLVNLGLIVNV